MELLIRVVDKERSGDIALDAQRTRAGDVIVAMPDGHDWTPTERSNPDWRIVHVPSLLDSEAITLVAGESPTAMAGTRVLQKRKVTIDLEQLDILEGGLILSNRQKKRTDATISLTNLRSCMSLKKPILDPRIVGPRRGVIG